MTILGAFHNPKEKTIVFSVHYLRPSNSKEYIVMPATGVYILIDGKRYPIHSSDTMMCGSHTAGQNVINEYTIRNYRVLGESVDIPGLRTLKRVTFGLDYTVNDKPVKIEKEVSITLYEGKTKDWAQAAKVGTSNVGQRPFLNSVFPYRRERSIGSLINEKAPHSR